VRRIDIETPEKLPGQLIKKDDTFSFQCHSRLSCFNLCCRNLNLFLYPYDVIRLKNRLGISSDQFLDKHVDAVMREDSHFPDVLLKMSENKEKTCPFLTASGCVVYSDRPDACRTFPVEQGLYYEAGKGRSTVISFFRPPDFCLGQHEDKTWTVQSWAEDQEAEDYHQMTVTWSKVKQLFQKDPWGSEGPQGRKAKMAFMVTYNIDRFRDFIFNSSFLKRYHVKTALLKKMKTDEVELLNFGFDWVKLFVWGIRAKQIRLR
jgi:Fe-S-cluster containining protein